MPKVLSIETPGLRKKIRDFSENLGGLRVELSDEESAKKFLNNVRVVKHFDHAERGRSISEPIPLKQLTSDDGLMGLLRIPLTLWEIMSEGIVQVDLIDEFDTTIISFKYVS